MTTIITISVILFVILLAAFFLKMRKSAARAPLPPYEGEVDPKKIIIMGEGTESNGLCMIFSNLFTQTLLKKPHKFNILRSMDTSIGIEDIKTKTSAVTMTFRDDKINMEGGIIGKPDIYIGTDPQTLMAFQTMKKSLKEIMADEPSKEVIKKYFRGELKLKGLFSNFGDFKKFTMLLK